MNNLLKTTVPIPVQTLRDIIGKPDVNLLVDLSESKVKPQQALIYLSNLELNVDVSFKEEDRLDILLAYLSLPTLLKCESLETMAIELLLYIKGIIAIDWVSVEWINDNSPIIEKWLSIMDSMGLYMSTTIKDDELNSVVDTYPKDTTSDTKGVNFVHLFTHELFPVLMSIIDEKKIRNYVHYFNDYMYKGRSLFYYWANPLNELHLLTLALTDDTFVTDEEFTQSLDELTSLYKEEG